MAKPKKKRKATTAQLRALAKGRKKAAANRRRSHKKQSTKGAQVARRKTTSSKKKAVRHTTRKSHSAPRRHHSKRRHSSGMSGGGSKMKGIMGPVSEALIAVAGGVIAGVVANKVPIKNEKLKAAAPILAGLGVSFMGIKKRNPLIRNLGTGMMVLGAVALTRKMLPSVPLLAGEDENTLMLPEYIAAQQAAQVAGELEYMGDDDDDLEVMGDPIDLGDDDIEDMLGDDELDEIHLTPANI